MIPNSGRAPNAAIGSGTGATAMGMAKLSNLFSYPIPRNGNLSERTDDKHLRGRNYLAVIAAHELFSAAGHI